jgi:glycosyltransferase involved in cell wall biosynthesis
MAGRCENEGCLIYLVPEYPPIIGGTGQVVADLVNALKADHPALVLTAGAAGASSIELSERATIVRMPVPFRLARYFDASNLSLLIFTIKCVWIGWRLGRKRPVRAIHAFHVAPTGLSAWALSKLLGAPFYVTAIGAEVIDPVARRSILRHPAYRWLVRQVLERARGVTAISSATAEATRSYHPGKAIRVIPPGLVAPASLPEKRPHAGIVLCTLCRLAPRKGIEPTFAALAKLDATFRYVVVGDGPLRPALEKLAADLGVADRVVFTGFVSQAEKYDRLSQADIFILPSLWEGFGITYLEAMACGLPVIAGSEGGQRDFLVDGENAILLRERSPEEMIAAVLKLSGDSNLRARMGEANRRKAAGFLMDRIARGYLELYDQGA